MDNYNAAHVCFVIHMRFLFGGNYINALLVHLHIVKLLKFKAKKLFQNIDADLSCLLFLKKLTCVSLSLSQAWCRKTR